jgi:hypothetical protein
MNHPRAPLHVPAVRTRDVKLVTETLVLEPGQKLTTLLGYGGNSDGP